MCLVTSWARLLLDADNVVVVSADTSHLVSLVGAVADSIADLAVHDAAAPDGALELIRCARAVDLVLAVLTILDAIAPEAAEDAPALTLAHELVVCASSKALNFVLGVGAVLLPVTLELLGQTLAGGALELIGETFVGFYNSEI